MACFKKVKNNSLNTSCNLLRVNILIGMKIQKVVVFCGSSLGFREIYKKKAIELGMYLAQNNMDLIYGAGKIGLMGVIADTVLEQKGKVIGVIPELLSKEEVLHPNLTETIVTKTMSERKVIMSEKTDAYIAMAGGFGTLDELFEVLTLQQLYIERKPIGLLNINGFFDATLKQLDIMVEEGFLKQKNRNMLFVDETIEGLMAKMNNYQKPENTSVINKVVK